MTRTARLSTLLLSTIAATIALHGPSHALLSKTFVSNTGNDAGSCNSATNACQTLAAAVGKTAPGGEVTVVNAGDYSNGGTINITHSIHITNDFGGDAGITVPAGQVGFAISAGVGDVVSLRGLVIDGQYVGTTGISIFQAQAVHIQNCVIRNFQAAGLGTGIGMVPVGNTDLLVSDTLIFNNGTVANTGGITIRPTGVGVANVVLDRVHLENNVNGLTVDSNSAASGAGSHVILRDSVASSNAGDGILAMTGTAHPPAFIVVERSTSVSNAGVGIHAVGPGGTILVSDTTISRNGQGVSANNAGQIISYGNNRNNNNVGAEGTATGTLPLF